MFLAESLNQKLKTSLENYDPKDSSKRLFKYTKPPQNPMILEIQRSVPYMTHEEIKDLTNEEFLNKFSLRKLHNKWNRKFQYNFESSSKKFIDECTKKDAKEAKKFLKDLLDRDIFEVKPLRWNKSTKPSNTNSFNSINSNNNFSSKCSSSDKVPLSKKIFDVNHGFIDFPVTKLKDKKNFEGIDSRNVHNYGNDWNISNKLEGGEVQRLEKDLTIKSMNNTQKYWLSRKFDRMKENVLPISRERKKFEEPRYYKNYKSPINLTIYNYTNMQKAKNQLSLEKEKIFQEEKKKNPGSINEKINYLTNKRMSAKYQEKFEILTGKKGEEAPADQKKIHWKDSEIAEKIQLINNWKDTKWFHPGKTFNADINKREILKDLVINKDQIAKEQQKLKDEQELKDKFNENKDINDINNNEDDDNYDNFDFKTINYMNYNNNCDNNIFQSKYPIKKNIYEAKKNSETINYSNNKDVFGENISEIVNSITGLKTFKDDKEPKLFLNAYKNVLIRNERKKNVLKKRQSQNKTKKLFDIRYKHPGKYREFHYEVNNSQKKEEETFMAWSCCNNTDPNSRGCQKIKIRKDKWNLDNA